MRKIYVKSVILCVFVFLVVWGCSQQTYDLVIHSGTIVDGSGTTGYQASVGITDGKIAKIGKIKSSQGVQAIDAGGKYVRPR
jgi:N-acyl-D-amino-acid deacylase